MFYFLELVQSGKDARTPLTFMLCTNDSLRATGKSANPPRAAYAAAIIKNPNIYFLFLFFLFLPIGLTEMVSNQIVDY